MPLPTQLKAARMSDGTQGATIDNHIGDLETALSLIFGFTLDVDITTSPFSLDNSGRITKQLVAQRAAGPVGWRFRDTTSGREVRIALNGTVFSIDENTGTEAVPVWTTRFSVDVTDGTLTGTSANTSWMGLCPAGSGTATEFLDGTLTWSEPAVSSPPSCKVTHASTQNVSSSSSTTMPWDTETWDTDTMHDPVTNNSRITPATAGKYIFAAEVSFPSNATGYRRVSLYKNGTTLLGTCAIAAVNGAATVLQVRGTVETVAGDYVTVIAYQTSGSTLAVTPSYFAAVKIG